MLPSSISTPPFPHRWHDPHPANEEQWADDEVEYLVGEKQAQCDVGECGEGVVGQFAGGEKLGETFLAIFRLGCSFSWSLVPQLMLLVNVGNGAGKSWR